jgi:UDP-3-O-[3-hydroxymyristoyl] glucosamine N-acyltransferase
MNKTISLKKLADRVGAEMMGDDMLIHNLNCLESATEGEITFIVRRNELDKIANTGASAVIVPDFNRENSKRQLKVKDPNLAAAIIHNLFEERVFKASGVHPAAHIGNNCQLPSAVTIGPMAVVGDRVKLGERVTVYPGVVIGDDVTVGNDTVLEANATVLSKCVIGARVLIHSGVVIGSDGYGYATDAVGNHVKRPQVGIVRIEDEVEIGANACVDRATFGETVIKRGAKIDNLVQVGHNVVVGENSLLIAQSGIAGSTVLGRNVVFGGQVGVTGHVKISDRVMVGAQSGIINNQPPGAVISGTPAIAHRQWLRASATFTKLPALAKEIKKLRAEIDKLHNQLKEKE